MNERGVSDFQRLQNALAAGSQDAPLYYVFDLLRRGGRDLAPLPLDARKQELAALLADAKVARDGVVRLSRHVVGQGAKVFAEACRLELEGHQISKRRDAPYRPGRNADWLKECKRRQEFVVGGFTRARASAQPLRRAAHRPQTRAASYATRRARWAPASPRRRSRRSTSGLLPARAGDAAVRRSAARRRGSRGEVDRAAPAGAIESPR